MKADCIIEVNKNIVDSPFKRSIKPFGGIHVIQDSLKLLIVLLITKLKKFLYILRVIMIVYSIFILQKCENQILTPVVVLIIFLMTYIER